jgi:hypothetical protein
MIIDSKQELISEFGLKKILHLDEIISQRQLEEKNDTFLIDLGFGSETDATIYPVTIHAKIKKKLFRGDKFLFLNNSFWRYSVQINNIECLHPDQRGASSKGYFFVEKKASNKNNYDLWLFEPGTLGWEYYQNILLPQHQRDLLDVLDLTNPQKKY